MAKARDIAALAGLAGLAFANRDKLFGSKDKSSGMTGNSSGMTPGQNDTLADVNRISKLSDESNTLARVNKENTPGQGAINDANAGVLNALSAPKAAPNDKAPSQGVLPPKSLTPEAKPKPRGMTAKQNDMLAKANRNRLTNENPNGSIEAPAASNRTDAMRNASRKAAAARTSKTSPNLYKSGGMTASSRADGIASRGKTRGKIC